VGGLLVGIGLLRRHRNSSSDETDIQTVKVGDPAVQALIDSGAATWDNDDNGNPVLVATGGSPPPSGYTTYTDNSGRTIIDLSQPVAVVVNETIKGPLVTLHDGNAIQNLIDQGYPTVTVPDPNDPTKVITYLQVPENLGNTVSSFSFKNAITLPDGTRLVDPAGPVVLETTAPQPADPSPETTPPPTTTPPPPPPDDDGDDWDEGPSEEDLGPAAPPDNSYKRAILKQHIQESQAEADDANAEASWYGTAENIASGAKFVADYGASAIAAFGGPAGKVFSHFYTTVTDVAGGIAAGDDSEAIWHRVAVDNTLTAITNDIYPSVPFSGTWQEALKTPISTFIHGVTEEIEQGVFESFLAGQALNIVENNAKAIGDAINSANEAINSVGEAVTTAASHAAQSVAESIGQTVHSWASHLFGS